MPETPCSDSNVNPLIAYLNNIGPTLDTLDRGFDDNDGNYRQVTTRKLFSYLFCLVFLVQSILLCCFLLIVFGFLLSHNIDLENNPLKVSNYQFLNDTDNICHTGKNPIFPVYISDKLKNLNHCEQVFDLGNSDFVYVCKFGEDVGIVFTTFNEKTNSTVDIGLTWRQYCTLLSITTILLDDLNYLVYSI